MAVPKKKQSHSRTGKRRAQHKILKPALNACPQCHSPRRPHRVCPVCGSYAGQRSSRRAPSHDHAHDDEYGLAGREGRRRRPLAKPSTTVVAVDCNGADLGPGEVAGGAAIAAREGARAVLFGPAASCSPRRRAPEGVEIVDAPLSIAKSADPARRARPVPRPRS